MKKSRKIVTAAAKEANRNKVTTAAAVISPSMASETNDADGEAIEVNATESNLVETVSFIITYYPLRISYAVF